MSGIGDKYKTEQYIRKANQIEEQYGIPKNLLVGLLKTESNFDPEVISGRRRSSAGAMGIAQFMPLTAKEFGINPLNPSQAIEAAGKYLSQNYKKLGNWDDTLRSYNMGLGNVYKWKKGVMKKLPKETEDYVGKVYSNMGAGANIQMAGDQVRETMNSFIPPVFMPNFSNDNIINYTSIDTEEVKAEDTEEVSEAKQKIDKASAEQQLITEFFAKNTQGVAESNPQQEQPQQVYEAPSISEQYAQVSQLVENPLAQEGRTINQEAFNKLPVEQQEAIKRELEFNKNWFDKRKNTFDKEGNPIPVEEGIFKSVGAFNPVVKSLDEMKLNIGLYSPKTGVTSLSEVFTKYPGTVAHEDTHQHQQAMGAKNWNKYVNLPAAHSMSLETLQKNAKGDEDKFTKYMRDPSEIHSFIQETRYLNNLDPTVPVTDDMVKGLKYDSSNTLKDFYSDEEIKNFLNSMVSTQPKSYDTVAQQGGNIPVSSQGVYDYPMQEVIVPTQDGRITMKNVNYPILGVDEYGNTQMMYPNQEYQYSGKVIHEIPQLKNYFNKK